MTHATCNRINIDKTMKTNAIQQIQWGESLKNTLVKRTKKTLESSKTRPHKYRETVVSPQKRYHHAQLRKQCQSDIICG